MSNFKSYKEFNENADNQRKLEFLVKDLASRLAEIDSKEEEIEKKLDQVRMRVIQKKSKS